MALRHARYWMQRSEGSHRKGEEGGGEIASCVRGEAPRSMRRERGSAEVWEGTVAGNVMWCWSRSRTGFDPDLSDQKHVN